MSGFQHVDDYPEIPVSVGSTRTALFTGAWRSVRPVLAQRTAPCSAGCPAGIGIPIYLHDISAGRLSEAFLAVAQRNPFPRITGRVCPRPCEGVCNLTPTDTEPVSIRAIERWLGDATTDVPHPVPSAETCKRIAVIGAGPAGLSAAYFLRRSGHTVTVFDRREQPGGMLRYGIPDYRLPTAIVEREIAKLETMGIEFRSNVTLGEDVTLDDLEAAFAAVFVATGAWHERPLGIDGDSLIEPGLAFLEAANRNAAELPGRRCAVIGGGNTAMDVARVLRKLGGDVTVLYRRTEAEMPAIREEYERAVADGVTFTWLSQPRSIKNDDRELVVSLEAMQLGPPDASGRFQPEPTGRTSEMRFDAVFAATGETADMTPFPDRKKDAAGWLDVAADGSTPDPLLFAGGDLATGPGTVIDAIVAGRRAARAIDVQLGFGDWWPVDDPADIVGSAEVNPTYVPKRPRATEATPTAATPFGEDMVTLSEALVRDEIERCFSCGHCNECGTCFVFCPDGAITWQNGPIVDLAFCKGCGICVTECPGHAFVLINERELSHA